MSGSETQPNPKPAGSALLSWWDRLTGNFLVNRLFRAVVIVWIVITIIFFLVRALPGNPIDLVIADMVVNRNMSEDEAMRRAAALYRIDLNKPVVEQYVEFMQNLARGDLGESYLNQGKTVAELIANRLPWTLFSISFSLLISFIIGMLIGMLTAYFRNSWVDHTFTNLSAALDATPAYLIGILAVLLLGVVWQIIPIDQMRGTTSPGIETGFTFEFFSDAFMHLRVPAMVYILATVGGWALMMKSSTVGTLGEDYVTVARARGLSDARIITAYVGRNASLPLFTALALSIGFAIGGSILIERIFTYPGIGLLLDNAITQRDYPIMQGIFLVTTIAVIITNMLADLLYGWLDPRIRISGKGN
jgi:peptide/nickel transport system permease protein